MNPAIKNTNHELMVTDSGQLGLKFVAKLQEAAADDPFKQWLHDEKSVRIDWSTFGIKQLKSE
jgi:hypothetical protein